MEKSVNQYELFLKSHLFGDPVVIERCGCDVEDFSAVIYFAEEERDRVEPAILKWLDKCDYVEGMKKADVCEDLEVTTGDIFMRVYNAIPVRYVKEKRELWVKADWINTCDFFLTKKETINDYGVF